MFKLKKVNTKKVIIILSVFYFMFCFTKECEALYSVNKDALRAVSYQESCVRALKNYVEFYRISLKLISPNPLTGASLIKGSANSSSYDRLFAKLDHNKKAQAQRNSYLWIDLIKSEEKKSIILLVNILKSTGQEIFNAPKWPNVKIPGTLQDESAAMFSMAPNSIRYIIPAFTGVVTGSSSQFDESMIQYLSAGIVFYPIVTFDVPIPNDIKNNKFKEVIFRNIMTQVPEAAISNNEEIRLTIFPGLDSMQTIIQRTRELLLSGTPENNKQNQ